MNEKSGPGRPDKKQRYIMNKHNIIDKHITAKDNNK